MKQHYVPQFFLRNFADARQRVFVFDKFEGRSWQSAVRDAAAERGFYDVPKAIMQQLITRVRERERNVEELGNVVLSMEHSLGNIEARAGTVIAGIIERRTLDWMTVEQMRDLASFATLQYLRSPTVRQIIHAAANGLRESVRSKIRGREEDKDRMLDAAGLPALSEDQAATEHLRMVSQLPDYFPHFVKKAWMLQEAPAAHPLMIGDAPVSVSNFGPRGESFHRGSGISSRYAEISLPLAPSLNLSLVCPTAMEAAEQEWERRWVTPTHRILRTWQSRRALMGGPGVPLESEHVLHLNSRQVRGASRFVYSREGSFELAREMIARDPSLRYSPKPQIS